MSDSPQLLMGKSLWGAQDASDPSKWDAMLERIAAEGYTFVESILIFDVNQNASYFRELLDKHKLGLIVQLHTGSDWSKFNYCTTIDVDTHIESFRELVTNCLQHHPSVINVHSGHDSWNTEDAIKYFMNVCRIEKELLVGNHSHVVLVHETHRQRLLFNPYTARDILNHPEIPDNLKINCDLSHWVCVCEKLFDIDDSRDIWWPPVLQAVAKRCHLVHGRIGHAEGPQVIHPKNTPKELHAHLSWWNILWKAQRERGSNSIVVTEHGPEPYQNYDTPQRRIDQSPLTDDEKSDILWEINDYVKNQIITAYNNMFGRREN
jgi:sugar phosphate isomerase/epimerase